jgi:phosphoglycerate dehydrogenase-like enzyme
MASPKGKATKKASTRPAAAPARAKRATARVHLHIDNDSELGEVFEVTPARLEAALKRHPAVAKRLHITMETDSHRLDEHLATADVLFGWRFDRSNLAQRAPKLRWIHAPGAGINHFIPFDWLPPGVVFTNNRGIHGERAHEYGIMAVLMLNNRLPEMFTNQRQGRWEQCFNSGIEGKTLLVIGVGSVGAGIAQWAKRFGMHVIGVRRTGAPRRGVDEMHTPDKIAKLLPRADFVVMATPATTNTRQLLGRKEIALLKPGAGLLNYSRAALVDYEALRERLEKREITAVLDVFDPEPLPADSPLWHTPNLIITPHSSSDDTERYTPKTLDLLFTQMARFIAGKKLANIVSRDLEY